MSGYKASKDRLTPLLGLMQLVTLSRSQRSLTILKIPGLLRIILSLLCLCSISGCFCLQHGLLNSSSLLLRPTAQKRRDSFQNIAAH